MLQKTSLRIKHFVTRRNKRVHTLGNDFDDARFTDFKLSTSTPKTLSWLSQTTSTEVFQLQRTSSNATTRSHHIHQSTAHSSASSLCSCDCSKNPAPVESLSVKSHTNQPEILYVPPESPASTSDDAKIWRPIFLERSPRSTSLDAASKLQIPSLTTPQPAFDISAILSNDPNDKTPTQSIRHTEEPDMEDLSENVEQLIRETDEAFKAVGTALADADAKAATQGWYDTKSPPVIRTISISRGILRKPRSPVSPHRSSVIKSSAQIPKSKVKRLLKKKPALFGKSHRTVPVSQSRWTLPDVTTNMADVLSGKRFRTEVDEMLTPGRIQKMRDQIAAEHERRESEESARSSTSFETDGSTPTEPFHLQSLSSRIDAVRLQEQINSPPSRPPPEVPREDTGPIAKGKKVEFIPQIMISGSRAGMLFDDFSLPNPPLLTPPWTPRRGSVNKGIPMLPTIPEISPLNLNSPSSFHQRTEIATKGAISHVVLPCTPFTMTSPLFRHGPIRIERLNRTRKGNLPLSPEEESLDWVAFQMAISGTMDMDQYGRHVPSDSIGEWESDEVVLDEIEAWWEGFGFGIGNMDPGPPSPREGRREIIQLPIPPNLSLNLNAVQLQKARQRQINFNVNRAAEAQLLRTWKAEIDAGKIVCPSAEPQAKTLLPLSGDVRKPSLAESMPPSPMLDLELAKRKLRGGDGDGDGEGEGEIIPMGFNLGHDLGDFLRWGTKEVMTLVDD